MEEEPEMFRNVLAWMYGYNLRLTVDKFLNYLSFADRLQIPTLAHKIITSQEGSLIIDELSYDDLQQILSGTPLFASFLNFSFTRKQLNRSIALSSECPHGYFS